MKTRHKIYSSKTFLTAFAVAAGAAALSSAGIAWAQVSLYGDAQCQACVQSKCSDLEGINLANLFDNKPNGRNALQCALSSDLRDRPLGLLAGYCGSVDDPNTCFNNAFVGAGEVPNGACKALFETAWGTTDRNAISLIAEDPTNQGGSVGFANECLNRDENCRVECLGAPFPSSAAPLLGGLGVLALGGGLLGLGAVGRRRIQNRYL